MTGRSHVPRRVRGRQWLGRVVDAVDVRPPRHGVRCLNYHSIVEDDRHDPQQMTTPVAMLRAQLEWLASRGYRVERASVVVDALRRGPAPDDRTVVLTFDDGFANNARLAVPLLREFGAPATFFVVTAALSGQRDRLHNPWVEEYMDWQQAEEIQAGGLIEFGCHSATHLKLRGLPDDRLREETEGAKRALEERLGTPVTLFAYPFGSYGSWDQAARAALQRSGFLGAFTTVFGLNTPSTDPFLLKRTRVSWTDTGPEFARLLHGSYDWYAAVQRLQGLATA